MLETYDQAAISVANKVRLPELCGHAEHNVDCACAIY